MPVLKNPRQEKFAQALFRGKALIESYEMAGYKPNRSAASRLADDVNICARVAELANRTVAKDEINRKWVLDMLVENARRSMQKEPVLDADGEPTGEYRYEGNVANKSLELIGRMFGVYIDRKEIGEPGEFERLADMELTEQLMAEVAELGLDMGEGQSRH